MKAFSPLKVGSALLRDVLEVREWTCSAILRDVLKVGHWMCPCAHLAQLLTLVLESGLESGLLDLLKDETH